jgi:hypothetical protein
MLTFQISVPDILLVPIKIYEFVPVSRRNVYKRSHEIIRKKLTTIIHVFSILD